MVRRLLLLPLIVSAAACASGNPVSGPVAVAPRPDTEWLKVVKEHYRRDQAWDWFVMEADLRALLVTPALRRSFADARPDFHGAFARDVEQELVGLGSPDERVDAPMRAAPQSEEQILVYAAFYVRDQVDRDIAASYTIWTTTLDGGPAGPGARPLEIDTLRNTVASEEIFPFVDRYDELYLLRFPGPLPASGTLTLTLASALGETQVEWTIAP